ncbi:serine hydrolase domain-containing protein [Lentibacillus salicampi]|uniref:Class A beta-lactamase-related serine hydrolase n=1 Tax=Lentibacillus salicampi TaxID=175306 RepID=A0A4Y9ADP5_9BACI|nr:serine hydrolase domain-containing protein [Lentibacillus salicampi]TFJ93227.1 class A beta-lactamase-related serine hydrolase [Lentibacillus salicampi]
MNKEKYERFAESLINTSHTPGAIIGINDQRYEKGFGFRDLENQLPVTADTIFGIGSITKSMTCIGILQLQEEGLLSVQDRIQTYLPEITFKGSSDITLHHLMTHTSGIPPLNTLFYANKPSMERDGSFDLQIKLGAPLDREQDSIDTYDDLINYLNAIQFVPLDQPGKSFSYSNDGYALLGIIIERVSGQPYERYIEKNIFRPLGMKNSFFHPDQLDEQAARLYSVDPTAETPTIEYSPEWWDAPVMRAAGYVKTTANDMLRFGDVFLNSGNGILSAESLNDLTSRHIEVEPGRHYGYGVMVTPDFFGTTLIEHGGGIKGVTAQFAVLPERSISAICLTNIAGAPAEALLKGAVQSEMDIDPEKPAIEYDHYAPTETDRQAITGTYQSNEGQTVKVYEKDATIFVEIQGTEMPTRSVGPRAVTITLHGTEHLMQFTNHRLHFGFRQLVRSEDE